MSRLSLSLLNALKSFPRFPYRGVSTKASSYLKRIEDIDSQTFSESDFKKEIAKLHVASQPKYGRLHPFSFGSDTGSSMSPEVIAGMVANNIRVKKYGFDRALISAQKNSIGEKFSTPTGKKDKFPKVYFCSSTSQSNKVAVTAVCNINPAHGEIALASEHSHVFIHEVGQPAEKIIPKDQVTGKLTVEDLEKSFSYHLKLGKRVKAIHLDQPTNGDYIYSPEEIKIIADWSHAKGMSLSIDIERLINYLPVSDLDYRNFAVESGADVVSFGMQKNGGPRSSVVVVINDEHLSDPKNLDQRVRSFTRAIGNVTDSPTLITSGWSDMMSESAYKEAAQRANSHSDRIAEVLSGFDFAPQLGKEGAIVGGEDLMQNYPLTTNMIFIKLPRDFVNLFNKITDLVGEKQFKLGPDRKGVTRIVAAHDVTDKETDNFIFCLQLSHQIYLAALRGETIENYQEEIDEALRKKSNSTSSQQEGSLNIGEIKAIFFELTKKFEESLESGKNLQGDKKVTHKLTNKEVPVDDSIMWSIFAKNCEGYHKPYGDDEVTLESKDLLREMFKPLLPNAPLAFTSSKEQAISCVMQFLKATDESVVLVSDFSDQHCKFGRSVKVLDASGEYAKTGKLDPRGVSAVLARHNSDQGKHNPLIAAVMIQQPTSSGYIYSEEEIKEITAIAHRYHVPVVMQMIGFSYSLARSGKKYEDYTTKCGVDICTIGWGGIGGGLSSAIVVLDSAFLSYQSDDNSYLQLMLDRTVKENGGKTSDSSSLVLGWGEMMENDLWLLNATISNIHLDNMMKFFVENNYQFEGKSLEMQNRDPQNNLIAIKLPDEFLTHLNKRGYEFEPDLDGYVRLRISYSATQEEVGRFHSSFAEAYQDFNKPKTPTPSIKPVAEMQLDARQSADLEI